MGNPEEIALHDPDPPSRPAETLVLLYPASGNAYLQQIKLRIQRKESLLVVGTNSAAEIREKVAAEGPGLLFAYVKNTEALEAVSACLSELGDLIKSRSLRVIGITDLDDPESESRLGKLGCMDVHRSSVIWESLDASISRVVGILAMQKIVGAMPVPQSRPRAPAWDEGEAVFNPEFNPCLKVWMGSSDPADTRLVEASVIEHDGDTVLLDIESKIYSEDQEALLILDSIAGKAESKLKIVVRLIAVIDTESDRQLATIAPATGLGKFLEPFEADQAKLQSGIFEFLKSTRGW